MCGAAACSRFPGAGACLPQFSAVPRRAPNRGAPGPFRWGKGGRQGGCPPSPIPGGGCRGFPAACAPGGGISLFPCGKRCGGGVCRSPSPPVRGAHSPFPEQDCGGGLLWGEGLYRLLSRRLPPFGAAGGAAELPRPKSTGFPGSEYSPRPGRPCWAAPRRWCWYR